MEEEKTGFEQEIEQKRALWKQEQDEMNSLWKDQEAQHKKFRQREEEEYIYKRDLERQKEQDIYLDKKQSLEKELVDKKAALEKEFKEREANISVKEQELQTLRMEAVEFPKKLQKAIADTEKAVTDRLRFTYDYETKLAKKEVEGEKKLHEQMIVALEGKIAEQNLQIKELTDKANHAGLQVQEIAVKAIDGASRQRISQQSYSEKSNEPSKN